MADNTKLGVDEFDKSAAIEQAKHEDSDGYFGFLTGAEWQFEKLRPVIQGLRNELTKAQMEIACLKDPYNFPQFLRDFQSLSHENKNKINQLAEALMACKK